MRGERHPVSCVNGPVGLHAVAAVQALADAGHPDSSSIQSAENRNQDESEISMNSNLKRLAQATAKMLTGIIASVALSILSGCQSTFDNMDAGLTSLRGKPYQAAIYVLGHPDAESRIADKRVFTWASRNVGSYTVPTFNSSTTYVNGEEPIYTETQGTATEIYEDYCKIDVIVGSWGMIEDTKYDGNIGGCDEYARWLRPSTQ